MSLPRSFNPWPAGIVAAFVLFAVGLAVVIVLAFSRRTELVATDYYDQEIRYQTQIDKLQRTRGLVTPARIVAEPERRRIVIRLPPEHGRLEIAGRIHLYRPSAAGLDRHLELAPDSDGVQELGMESLQAGLWNVRVEWTAAGQAYAANQNVIVPPTP
jgi:hypothetical protein